MNEFVIYKNKYKVYSDGSILNMNSEKYIAPFIESSSGRVCVNIISNGVRKKEYLSKIVAELFVKKPADVPCFVFHKNGNKLDNSANNLMWKSKSDVMYANNKTEAFKRAKENHKKSVKILNKKLCIEEEFDSITDAALYIISTGVGPSTNLNTVKVNISLAAKRNGSFYGWKVTIIDKEKY